MNRIYGMVMAAGLVLGHTSTADAQVSVSVGNPFTGTGVYFGSGTTYYGSGYSGYVAPGTTSFSSGYYAPAPYVYPPVYTAPAYRAPVVVPYRTYGYRTYRRGFRIPFLGLGRRSW